MTHSSITTLMLLETHDLEIAQAFLSLFGVLKIANEGTSQSAWNYLEHPKSAIGEFCLGIIREEWKEPSIYFSQRFGVRHQSPQFCLIAKKQPIRVWSQEEIMQLDLARELALAVDSAGEIHAMQAFRLLGQVKEMEPSTSDWHQAWLSRLQSHLKVAKIDSPMREPLEKFAEQWSAAFKGPWSDQKAAQQVAFFNHAQELHYTWWQLVTHQPINERFYSDLSGPSISSKAAL